MLEYLASQKALRIFVSSPSAPAARGRVVLLNDRPHTTTSLPLPPCSRTDPRPRGRDAVTTASPPDSVSPSQISSAGPTSVIRFCSSSSTRSSPPGMRTVTGLSHQPFVTAAAAAATALDPEALVSPAPRSHTSTVSSLLPSTPTSWTFVRSGKRCSPRAAGRAGAAPRARGSRVRPHVGCRRTPQSARPARPSSSTVSISPTSTSPTPIAIVPSSRMAAGYDAPRPRSSPEPRRRAG